jgi:hypothetical protein
MLEIFTERDLGWRQENCWLLLLHATPVSANMDSKIVDALAVISYLHVSLSTAPLLMFSFANKPPILCHRYYP